MIILDTNVLSELVRPEPVQAVIDWVDAQPVADLFITTLTQAEILYGVALLPPGRRRRRLDDALQAILFEDFRGRILTFDSLAAISYAEIASSRRQTGRPISQMDAQIAAIARSQQAIVATRNISDFEGCGVELINPWGLEVS